MNCTNINGDINKSVLTTLKLWVMSKIIFLAMKILETETFEAVIVAAMIAKAEAAVMNGAMESKLQKL